MTSNFERYQRIAPLYDLLDMPFEHCRYRGLRPLLFEDLSGHFWMPESVLDEIFLSTYRRRR